MVIIIAGMAITKPIHTYSCPLIINDLIIIKRSIAYVFNLYDERTSNFHGSATDCKLVVSIGNGIII